MARRATRTGWLCAALCMSATASASPSEEGEADDVQEPVADLPPPLEKKKAKKKPNVSKVFSDDLEVRYWMMPDQLAGFEDTRVLDYVEAVNRFTANVRVDRWSFYGQLDAVGLFANVYYLDDVPQIERELLQPRAVVAAHRWGVRPEHPRPGGLGPGVAQRVLQPREDPHRVRGPEALAAHRRHLRRLWPRHRAQREPQRRHRHRHLDPGPQGRVAPGRMGHHGAVRSDEPPAGLPGQPQPRHLRRPPAHPGRLALRTLRPGPGEPRCPRRRLQLRLGRGLGGRLRGAGAAAGSRRRRHHPGSARSGSDGLVPGRRRLRLPHGRPLHLWRQRGGLRALPVLGDLCGSHHVARGGQALPQRRARELAAGTRAVRSRHRAHPRVRARDHRGQLSHAQLERPLGRPGAHGLDGDPRRAGAVLVAGRLPRRRPQPAALQHRA